MLEFQVTYKPTFCSEWPKIRVLNNDKVIDDLVCDGDHFTFKLIPEPKNNLKLHWYNKKESHTECIDGKIVADQTFEFTNLRIDNIQVESWMMTDGCYYPAYFKGFIDSHQRSRVNTSLPEKLDSQLIWHFPGVFEFATFTDPFWDWYFDVKQEREVIKFLEKDPDKTHKFRGSLDLCEDITSKIKELL